MMKQFNNVFKTFFALVFLTALLLITGCQSSKVEKSSGNQLVLDSAIKQGTLDNGMKYFIRENAEPKNRIQLRLIVKAGSCMEDDDQKGIAHFIEHLCFNGTEHFEKSAIVDYFESIGMSFGPEVNAETNFENTVYMLELPADNPEILKTSLMVLHDWACAVTFDPEEIEKERGVIVEEWRMRNLGVQGRALEKEINLLFKDTRYADRLPIGDMDIIRNISHERIIDFYKKWYRPELMSVVAVGDIKTSVIESAIKEIMGTIPASEKKIKAPEFKTSDSNQKTITTMRDKELSIIETYIFSQSKEKVPLTTVEGLKENFAYALGSAIFNQRCQEKSSLADALWLVAGVGNMSLVNNHTIYVLQVYPKTGLYTEAFKALIDEYERFMNYGVTDSELERMKQAYIMSLQQNYATKDAHPSAGYAANIVSYVLTGSVVLSEEDNLKLGTEIINQITGEDILAAFKNAFGDRGTNMFVLAPDSMEIPSEKEITDIWKNYESEAGKTAYVDDLADSILMEKPAKKAKIAEKKAIKELGGTQYTLENGVKIITKKTDFQKDTIAIYAGSKGGLFQLKEEDIPSARTAVEYAISSGVGGKTYNQVTKIASAKNMSVNLSISMTEESINASANSDNIEETLQYINLIFNNPQFDANAWKNLIGQYNQIAETYGARPIQEFSQKLNEAIYGKTNFYSGLTPEFVAQMDPEKAEKIFRERFGNAADFTFVLTGDFDEKKVLDLCAYYLGNILTNDSKEETKYVYFPFPASNKIVAVNKGMDNTGDVYMCFGGELDKLPEDGLDQGLRESIIINQLAAVLDIRLREVIREDKSGSYGVSCGGLIEGYPERFYNVNIEFGCEPAREEELVAAVIETIKDIQKGNISDEIVAKVKEAYVRSVETSLRNNYWWINRFCAEIIYTYEPLWFTKNSQKAADWITKEALVDAANKYLNTDRMVTGYLKPEK